MPDSMNMNMMGQSLLLAVVHKVLSTEAVLRTSQYTLTILNTIKPVTRAFVVTDVAKLARLIGYTQLGTGVYNKTLPGIQRATGHTSNQLGKR